MTIVLGPNQYGKAENRVVRLYRDGARHDIRDVNVSTSLRGEFSDAHLVGDQSRVLPTDTQKNTVYAYAKEKGLGQIEDYALGLARHFVDDVEPVQGARIEIDEHAWGRIEVDGRPHDHSFVRRGQETRTTIVTLDGKDAAQRAWVVSGLKDLVVLKSTGSEFHGFLTDPYTTLRETTDRVMATSLVARYEREAIGQLLRKNFIVRSFHIVGSAGLGSNTDSRRTGIVAITGQGRSTACDLSHPAFCVKSVIICWI